jgi:UDP-N-acetyl-D-mannosaminuronic acid dehydrogenase
VSTDRAIAVIGLGYIGLPTAAILASRGFDVTGVDLNPRHVDAVNRGEVPFVEPALGDYVAGAVADGRLRAQAATPAADVFIIAVPTPFAEGYKVDTKYIDAATDALLPHLTGSELVILESTSPPGTTEHVAARVAAARPELGGIEYAHAPERVLPGRVMEELVTNDRIIGGLTRAAAERTRALYATFCDAELHLTDARTAEMAKLTENAFRDVNIAFANELSLISGELGIDVWELIELANKHPRVNILQPGPGVGGHCIAVDPWFIVSSAPDTARLIRTAREVNDGKPTWVIDQVVQASAETENPTIAALGLAFKPDIDDLRESPALSITRQLPGAVQGATVLAVEPNIDELPPALADAGIELASVEDAIARADIVLLLVDHQEFKSLDRALLSGKTIIDTRGTWRDR